VALIGIRRVAACPPGRAYRLRGIADLALAAHSHSPAWTLAAFTFAVFCATCSWMSSYPTFAELFPTHLRATGIGASVSGGRIGGMVGVVVLAALAPRFGLNSSFTMLAVPEHGTGTRDALTHRAHAQPVLRNPRDHGDRTWIT
jgi:hypothetical protein